MRVEMGLPPRSVIAGGLALFCLTCSSLASAQIPPLLDDTPPVLESLGPLLDGVGNSLNGTLDGVGNSLNGTLAPLLPPSVLPILHQIVLPGPVTNAISITCGALPLSPSCSQLLKLVAIQLPATQQVIASAAAVSNARASSQIADFALSTVVLDGLIASSSSGAVIRTISPTVTSFGISGVSHTSHDGFEIQTGSASLGRTLGFDSLDAGVTLGLRIDASRAFNLPRDFLTLGAFGNYTNSDIDIDSDPALRAFGFSNVGDATLDSGSAGGFALLSDGTIYGLAIGSGEFGTAEVENGFGGGHSDFDTSGFVSSVYAGAIIPAGSRARIDFRTGLNYLSERADDSIGFGGLRLSDGKLEEFSGMMSGRLFTSWDYGRTVIRPFIQAGVDYRFDYENEIEIETVNVSFIEGKTTVFERVGVDFDIGERSQFYVAFRGDHNEDFDTLSGQAGLTFKLN